VTAADDLASLAALGDPLRRTLYELASASSDGVTRETAAQAAGVARHVAAYHLDQLTAHGLLDVERRRQGGRSGPGAGRPAKVYRRAARAVEVSVPPRNYRLASGVLLDAVTAGAATESTRAQLSAAATRRGVEMGVAARRGRRARSDGASLATLLGVLRDSGFEPLRDSDSVRLRNCAFHELAQQDRATVCAMNLALMRGVAEGLGVDPQAACQEPDPHGCCVAFHLGGATPSAPS